MCAAEEWPHFSHFRGGFMMVIQIKVRARTNNVTAILRRPAVLPTAVESRAMPAGMRDQSSADALQPVETRTGEHHRPAGA